MRAAASFAFALAALIASAAQAQNPVSVKIGVLTDMSSLYADENLARGTVPTPGDAQLSLPGLAFA